MNEPGGLSPAPAPPVPAEPLTGLALAALGFSVGACFGFVELVLLGIERFGLNRVIMRSREVVWMTPLGYAVGFGILGLLLASVTGRRGLRPKVAVGIFVFLACASLLLLYVGRLHPIAHFALAGGIAVQAVRLTERKGTSLARGSRRWAVGLAVLIAAVVMVSLGGRWIRERRALASLAPARPGAPNVLLIILDTVRSLDLSLYGYERPTSPAISRLATTGVTFDEAVSVAPWTVLSHATIFTGELLDGHHADWFSRLDPTVPTLAAIFRRQGYRTGGFSANETHAGWEFGFARDFIHFEDHDISLPEVLDATTLGKFTSDHVRTRRLLDFWDLVGRTNADDINEKTLNWLDRSGDRPFFLFLNYFDAHTPRMPPEPFAGQFGASRPKASLRSRVRGFVFPAPKPHKSKNAYDASIAYIDDRVGQLLDSLRQKGLLDNTLVIVTSDHGELLGEHGLEGHANSLYFPNLHVPLVLSMPGTIPANRRIEVPVTLRDLAATILDLSGVHVSPGVPGVTLTRYWHDMPSATPTPILSEITGLPNLGKKVPVGRGDMVSLVRDSLHYIRNGDGVEELYNIRRDPTESAALGAEFNNELAGMRRVVDSVYVPRHKQAGH